MGFRLLYLLLFLAGCKSSHEIIATPPVPATPSPATAQVATLQIFFEQGQSKVPPDIQQLRFHLRTVGLSSDTLTQRWSINRSIQITPDQLFHQLLLTTEVPAHTYDSLYIALAQPYLTFSPNAGGPLAMTLPEMTIPASFQLKPGGQYALYIRFEPEPSLWRDKHCHWHFEPFIVPVLNALSPTQKYSEAPDQ